MVNDATAADRHDDRHCDEYIGNDSLDFGGVAKKISHQVGHAMR